MNSSVFIRSYLFNFIIFKISGLFKYLIRIDRETILTGKYKVLLGN